MLDPFLRWPGLLHHGGAQHGSGPRVNAHEDGGAVYFEVEVPRYRPEEISVTTDLDNGILTIAGTRAGGGADAHFERRFSVLTDVVDLAQLQSKVELGVLSITIPKKPESPIAPPPAAGTLTATTAGALTSPSYDAATKMSWPPKFDVADSATELVYTAVLPGELAADNVDVHLERGGDLSVSVRAHLENVKKNEKGEVTFSESRSLQYSTHLAVPRNTQPNDIAVTLKNGSLRVGVAKHHGASGSKIKVNQA